jgi:DNA repair protein RadC
MITTVNEIKLSYRPNKELLDGGKITSSQDAFNLLYSLFDQDSIYLREEFIILYLNRANKILGYYKAFTGGVSGVVCDTRIILAIALKGLASGIILAHNHPSGNRKPSEQDKKLTQKVKLVSREMDIQLMDHLIITPEGNYFSFSDEGLI